MKKTKIEKIVKGILRPLNEDLILDSLLQDDGSEDRILKVVTQKATYELWKSGKNFSLVNSSAKDSPLTDKKGVCLKKLISHIKDDCLTDDEKSKLDVP